MKVKVGIYPYSNQCLLLFLLFLPLPNYFLQTKLFLTRTKLGVDTFLPHLQATTCRPHAGNLLRTTLCNAR